MSFAAFNAVDLLGYLGAACVLSAFSVRRLTLLRSISIVGNITFIIYAVLASVNPVLLMNSALLVLNVFRLSQQLLETCAASKKQKVSVCAA